MAEALKRIRVCAAVVRDGSKTLLCQRPEGAPHAGFWEFPGGKLQSGESEHECLRREILEELGCPTFPLDLVFDIEHEYPGKSVSIGFYRTLPAAGRCELFQPREGQRLQWIETSALPSMPLLPADLPLAEFLAKGAKPRNKTRRGGVIS